MYTPHHFKNENIQEVKSFISQNSFGILISKNNERIIGSHIPLNLNINRMGEDVLWGHISKSNNLLNCISNEEEVLTIFSGSHAYISSSWYNHENVPTWNYIAVHVYGKIKILTQEELWNTLKILVDKHEKNSGNPLSIEKLNTEYIEKQMKGIVGFEIKVLEIQAAKKLSQNRDDVNQDLIINQLENQSDRGSHEIAQEMKRIKK